MYEPYSMLYKGKLILEKNKNNPKNPANSYAYHLINKAASYAIQDAYAEMIWMHCKGVGTFQSQNEAYYWLEKIKAIPNISNATITSFEECIKK